MYKNKLNKNTNKRRLLYKLQLPLLKLKKQLNQHSRNKNPDKLKKRRLNKRDRLYNNNHNQLLSPRKRMKLPRRDLDSQVLSRVFLSNKKN